MSDDADLDQLRASTDHGDRLDEAAEAGNREDLRESITEYLDEIDDSDRQKTVSVWDGEIAALLAALEDHPEDRARVGDSLREALELDTDEEVDRSDVIRLALRLGLREAAPEEMQTVREAVQDRAARGL
jgi:hypothetical protein